MTYDITATLAAKSDQLNAVDIIAGPIVVQITHVSDGKDEKQPVAVSITGGYKPWLACKAMRRLIASQWGADAGQWIGRWVRLYNEPTVTYGNDPQGGIRVSGLSHIDKSFTATIPDSVTVDDKGTMKKKKLATYRVEKLTPPKAEPMPLDTFRSWIGHAMKNGWTKEQVGALLGVEKADDVPADKRADIVAALKEPAPNTNSNT